MKNSHPLSLLLVLLFCPGALPGLATTAEPPENAIIIEAQAHPGAGKVVPDESALGGAYVASDRQWQPLFNHALPEDFTRGSVWVRFRGVPVQLKGVLETGTQTELRWSFTPPADWQWRNLGTYNRSQLGERILVIRGSGDEPNAGLDAVALVPLAGSGEVTEEHAVLRDEEAGKTAAPDGPSQMELAVDWSATVHPAERDVYAMAVFAGFDPEIAANPEYQRNMQYLNPSVVRYHNVAMMRDSKEHSMGWLNFEERTWDAEKINAALSAWNPPGVEKVINIPNWPPWMDRDGDGYLDEDKIEDFMRLCAELVRIVNVEQGHGIKYWEITNERDVLYWLEPAQRNAPQRIADLAEIVHRTAQAMKKTDPSIKTGGPAATRPDLVRELSEFVRGTKDSLDFLSFHAYASGDITEPDADIYAKASSIGRHVARINEMLAAAAPGRDIETHLNEWNISWTWRTREPRMANHKGAVFDALVLIECARNGLTVGNAWNERDNIYGKMSNDYELRPAAHVFHFFNKYLAGDAVETVSTGPASAAVETFAVRSPEHETLLLVNKSDHPHEVTATDLRSIPLRQVVIDANGLHDSSGDAEDLTKPLQLPPHSVTFLIAPARETAPEAEETT